MKKPQEIDARRTSALLAALVCSCLGACASNDEAPRHVDAGALLGTWTVDLRPTPGSEPYYKEFVVTSVEENSFTGTFYDTAISEARINTSWGKLRVAFVTADGSGEYHHSAVLEGSKLEGLSNSTGRGFLSFWSAIKQ